MIVIDAIGAIDYCICESAFLLSLLLLFKTIFGDKERFATGKRGQKGGTNVVAEKSSAGHVSTGQRLPKMPPSSPWLKVTDAPLRPRLS